MLHCQKSVDKIQFRDLLFHPTPLKKSYDYNIEKLVTKLPYSYDSFKENLLRTIYYLKLDLRVQLNFANTKNSLCSRFSAQINDSVGQTAFFSIMSHTQSISFWVHLYAKPSHLTIVCYSDSKFFFNVTFMNRILQFTEIEFIEKTIVIKDLKANAHTQ